VLECTSDKIQSGIISSRKGIPANHFKKNEGKDPVGFRRGCNVGDQFP
jgi:hypothetical protein